jgi:hypothetical protein
MYVCIYVFEYIVLVAAIIYEYIGLAKAATCIRTVVQYILVYVHIHFRLAVPAL